MPRLRDIDFARCHDDLPRRYQLPFLEIISSIAPALVARPWATPSSPIRGRHDIFSTTRSASRRADMRTLVDDIVYIAFSAFGRAARRAARPPRRRQCDVKAAISLMMGTIYCRLPLFLPFPWPRHLLIDVAAYYQPFSMTTMPYNTEERIATPCLRELPTAAPARRRLDKISTDDAIIQRRGANEASPLPRKCAPDIALRLRRRLPPAPRLL